MGAKLAWTCIRWKKERRKEREKERKKEDWSRKGKEN